MRVEGGEAAVTDMDASSFEEMLSPWLDHEVVLTSGAQTHAEWRTTGVPVTLRSAAKDQAPVLMVTDGHSRLVIGFDPFTRLGPEHAALTSQLAAAASALALEVSLYARGGTVPQAASIDQTIPVWRSWVTYIHLRPGQTRVRMDPCDGDVPRLDLISDEALCSLTLGVELVEQLGPEHAAVAGEFAAAAEQFAADVEALAEAAESELES